MKTITDAQLAASAIVALLEGKPGGSAKTEALHEELGIPFGVMSLALGIAARKGYVVASVLHSTVTLTELGRTTLAEGRAKIDADAT